MAIWVILLCLLAFLLLILLLPFTIYADTQEQRYSLSWPVLFRMVVYGSENGYRGKFYVFFIPFRMDISPMKIKYPSLKSKGKKTKVLSEPHTLAKIRIYYRFLRALWSSFRLKRLEATFDTGDYAVNAILVPLLTCVNGKKVNVFVNFSETWAVLLKIRNNLGRIAWLGLLLWIRLKFIDKKS